MDFMKLFQSLENAVYEIVTWVMFLPKTLIHTMFKPAWALEYINEEWKKEEKDRFDDFQSPVILWLLVVVIPMLVVPYMNPLPGLVDIFLLSGVDASQINQFKLEQKAFFVLLYALTMPVSALIWLEWRNDQPLRKSLLKRNFYQQCYIIAPAQFLFITLVFILAIVNLLDEQGYMIFFLNAGVAWFYQIFFFRAELEKIKNNWGKAMLHAIMPQVIVFFIFLAIGVILGFVL